MADAWTTVLATTCSAISTLKLKPSWTKLGVVGGMGRRGGLVVGG
jgi:hypothetical protein